MSPSPLPAVTEQPIQPTFVPTPAAQAATVEATATPRIEPTSAPSPASATGTVVLRVPAGNGPGEVGITAEAAPTTFRVAADGSLRIMDVVNKRILFFNGANGKHEQTINLSFLQQPTDFVVTGKGDLYVLDAGSWTIQHLSISGKELGSIPVNPLLNGRFDMISLTADGRVVGLGKDQGYVLINGAGPIPVNEQPQALLDGAVTVRSNATFSLYQPVDQTVLSIHYENVTIGTFEIGQDSNAEFLDVNQGMEPYVALRRGTTTEIRRYGLSGMQIGTLLLDQANCRPATRSIYIDRPGDVFTMCVSDDGVTITRYTMTDGGGQPLPHFEQLMESVPWSPGNLQTAPG